MTDQRLADVEEHTVMDREQNLVFNGVRIGASSSHQPGKQRWAEIYIFRTEAGSYVVAGIGRSKIEGERDKCWADVFDDPNDVVERLYIEDSDGGGRHLPYVSRDAMEEAHRADPLFPAGYPVRHVD